MRYRLQRHDGTDCSATMVPITVLRMVPIQRYRQMMNISPFYLMNIPVTVGNYKPQLTFIQVGNYLDGLLKMIKMN